MARHARQRHSLVALTSHSLASFGNNNNGSYNSTNSNGLNNGSITSPLSPTSPPTPSSLGSPQFQRRPSVPSTTPYLFSFISTPPSSPTSITTPSPTQTPISSSSSPLFSLEARDVARYLTLADFYTLKCITSYDYICGGWRRNNNGSGVERDDGYIGMMTKRANLVSKY